MSKKIAKKLSIIITGLILFAIVGFFGSLNVPQTEATTLLCGDVNCDGAVNTDDSTLLFNYHVSDAEQYPICSEWAADVNCDGKISLSDSVKISNYVNNPDQYILGCCSEEQTCTDTDNGESIFEKGTACRPSTVTSGLFCKTDTCVSSTSLKEYYCNGEAIMSRTIACSNGCEDGACLQEPEPEQPFCGNGICEIGETPENCSEDCTTTVTCTDTDNGNNIYEKGITRLTSVYGAVIKYTDVCLSSTSLKEYYCDESQGPLISKIVTCENGCEDGVCVRDTEQPVCGDVNCDGVVNTDDSTLLFNYHVSSAEQYPICSEWAADVNCDGKISLSDSVKISNYVNNPDQYILGCCSTCQILGDADDNGVLTCNDMDCAFDVSLDPSTQDQCPCSDVDKDGKTTMSDVKKIFTILQENGINCDWTASVTVTSPNGGETWIAGETYNIEWDTVGYLPIIEINLYKGDSYERRLVSGLANDGGYSWTIPADVAPGDDYKIRVEGAVNGVIDEDFSDDYFSIIPSAITIYDPIRDNDMKALVVAGTCFANDDSRCLDGQSLADDWAELGFNTSFYCDTPRTPLEHPYTTYQSDPAIKLVGLVGHGLNGNLVVWDQDIARAQYIKQRYEERGNIPYSMFWLSACGCNKTGDGTFADYVTQNYTNNCPYKGLTAIGLETRHEYHQYLDQGYTVYDAWNTTLEWAKETFCPSGDCLGYLQWEWGTVMPNENLRLPQFCGDVNYDNVVNSTDVQVLKDYLNGTGEIHSDWDGDINGDENVDETDLFYLERHINNNTAAPHPSPRGWFITPCQIYDFNSVKGIQQDEIDQAKEDYDNGYLSQSDYLDVTSCNKISSSLPEGTLIKLPDNPKVYVIKDSQKKWIKTIDEFNQEGYKWENVKETNSEVINAYVDYLETTANLLRTIGHNKVYRIVNEKRLWIPTIAVFNAQGLKWNDIQNVQETEVNQYTRLKLAKLTNKPEVYYLTENGLKRHIPTADVFNSYGNKWEDIVEISFSELNAYPDSTLIKAENNYKIYKLENGKKKWIKTAGAFNRLGYDWNQISLINKVEINSYSSGVNIE
ncbi:MAG: hypothetical protein KAS87_00675 [Candidatus Omnitrophica bacterium]|nr:hypothetical protein [Candidatus Omnitrophota bacterium]